MRGNGPADEGKVGDLKPPRLQSTEESFTLSQEPIPQATDIEPHGGPSSTACVNPPQPALLCAENPTGKQCSSPAHTPQFSPPDNEVLHSFLEQQSVEHPTRTNLFSDNSKEGINNANSNSMNRFCGQNVLQSRTQSPVGRESVAMSFDNNYMSARSMSPVIGRMRGTTSQQNDSLSRMVSAGSGSLAGNYVSQNDAVRPITREHVSYARGYGESTSGVGMGTTPHDLRQPTSSTGPVARQTSPLPLSSRIPVGGCSGFHTARESGLYPSSPSADQASLRPNSTPYGISHRATIPCQSPVHRPDSCRIIGSSAGSPPRVQNYPERQLSQQQMIAAYAGGATLHGGVTSYQHQSPLMYNR